MAEYSRVDWVPFVLKPLCKRRMSTIFQGDLQVDKSLQPIESCHLHSFKVTEMLLDPPTGTL